MEEYFEIVIKVGCLVVRQAKDVGMRFIVSECLLAVDYILQGIERQFDEGQIVLARSYHLVELFVLVYGLALELNT